MQVQFPPSALSESVLCNLKSAIRILQSIIVLPGVLGWWPLRRTVQVRLGTNPAVPRDGCPVARPPRLARMAGRHVHLRGLATVIHEISGLASCKKPGIDVRLFSPTRGGEIHSAPVAQMDRATDF